MIERGKKTSMQCQRRWFTMLAMSAVPATALASEPPVPRPSIGPKVMEMIPAAANPLHHILQSMAADRIRIVSTADERLHFTYWDGEAWKQESVEAKRFKDIACLKCAGMITVAFHDGKNAKSVNVRTGTTYLLTWSGEAGAWVLTSSTNR